MVCCPFLHATLLLQLVVRQVVLLLLCSEPSTCHPTRCMLLATLPALQARPGAASARA